MVFHNFDPRKSIQGQILLPKLQRNAIFDENPFFQKNDLFGYEKPYFGQIR